MLIDTKNDLERLEVACDLIVLAVRVEVLGEVCAGDGLLEELLVDLLEDGHDGLMGNLLDLVEDLLISLLGLAALLGVSAAERLGEQLSEGTFSSS